MQWIFQKGLRANYLIHWTFTLYGSSLIWLMCLPPLSQLIHLFNSFLCLFPSYFIDPTLFQYFYLIWLKPSPSIVVAVCYNVRDKRSVINVWCNDYLHAYNRLFKMGMISCKNKHPHFYAYNELLVGLISIWLFVSMKKSEWNTIG